MQKSSTGSAAAIVNAHGKLGDNFPSGRRGGVVTTLAAFFLGQDTLVTRAVCFVSVPRAAVKIDRDI